MTAVFLRILNLGIAAGWLILAVVAARLLLRRAPKRLVCALWILVAVRLLCPVRLESSLSLLPAADPVTVTQESAPAKNAPGSDAAFSDGLPGVCPVSPENEPATVVVGTPQGTDPAQSQQTQPVAQPIDNSAQIIAGAKEPANSDSPAKSKSSLLQATLSPRASRIAAAVWMAGAVLILGFAVVSYLRIRRTVAASIAVGDRLYACDDISSPFILSIVRPRIYVPSSVKGEALAHVVAHESAHLRRRDHWWKPLGYLLLAVYWFNPLCWLAYALLCRDIELACDESVIHAMSHDDIAAYSQTLLDFNRLRRTVAVCPLAFGMVGVKRRVKSVLNYKKPPFWIILAAVVIGIILAVCFITSPKKGSNSDAAPTPTVTATPTPGEATSPTPRITGEIMNVEINTFICQITQIGASSFKVTPSWMESQMTRFYEIEIPNEWLPSSPKPIVGSWLEIGFDGRVENSYPSRLVNISSVRLYLTPVRPVVSIEELRKNNPDLFSMDASKGFTVAVWQLSAGSYSCALFSGKNVDRRSLMDGILSMRSAGGYDLATMRAILQSYHVTKEQVVIQHTGNPLSSYAGPFNDDNYAYVESMLFGAAGIHSFMAHAGWVDDSGDRLYPLYRTAVNYDEYVASLPLSHAYPMRPLFRIDSQRELDAFCDRALGVGLRVSDGYDDEPSLLQAIAENGFAGDFYDDYSLLITYVTSGSIPRIFDVECILLDDDSLCMRIARTDKYGDLGSSAMGGWYVVAAVPKSYLAGRTTITADYDIMKK